MLISKFQSKWEFQPFAPLVPRSEKIVTEAASADSPGEDFSPKGDATL
jgi:hypothetical protein